jgi:hypothetical protein
MMGKAKAQQRLIDNLEDEFAKVPADNLIARILLSGSNFSIRTLSQ